MSFAIIETGGKQYKVSTSKILEVEKLNIKKGETIPKSTLKNAAKKKGKIGQKARFAITLGKLRKKRG